MILANGEFGLLFKNWKMENWTVFYTASASFVALLAIIAGTAWVVYQVKKDNRRALYSNKVEVFSLFNMILSDYDKSLLNVYEYTERDDERGVDLNHSVWGTAITAFRTTRMANLSLMLVLDDSGKWNQSNDPNQLEVKFNNEILYIEKMRQYAATSFKKKETAKLVSTFLKNYKEVLATFMFLLKFAENNGETFEEVFDDLKGIPVIDEQHNQEKLELQIEELHKVYLDRKNVLNKITKEAKIIS
ncbi:hypothetical protein ESZ50_10340 [Weissella muntiaci]|uniref:Uncharacterized protein n=1 Tax=Weissella muntiaci TaxID=2508881 RepID=A0A6C2C1Z3_9LACO|nr:hypothetical protein [Weissella muntiaci]TYC48018.1 hypothetical protein ESZ50_10340 [Weissella muntiaci]